MFVQYPEVALFWKNYADDEDGHAKFLQHLKDHLGVNRLSQQIIKDIPNMRRKALSCLEQSSPVKLKDVRTLEDAYQLATDLENSETNAIFEFMRENFSMDELAKSREFLRTQLTTHIDRLVDEFPTSYRSAALRRNVPAFLSSEFLVIPSDR